MKKPKGKDAIIHALKCKAGRLEQLYKEEKQKKNKNHSTMAWEGMMNEAQKKLFTQEKRNNEIIEQIKYANKLRERALMKVIAMLGGKTNGL